MWLVAAMLLLAVFVAFAVAFFCTLAAGLRWQLRPKMRIRCTAWPQGEHCIKLRNTATSLAMTICTTNGVSMQ
jgi:hypothetical protein